MAEPYRGILGPVLGQVEAIRAARSNRAMDELQSRYLGERIQTEQLGRQQSTEAAARQQDLDIFLGGLNAIHASDKPSVTGPRIVSSPQWQSSASRLGMPAQEFLNTGDLDDNAWRSNTADLLRQAGIEVKQAPPMAAAPYAGPGGSLLQADPTTGMVKEVLGREGGTGGAQVGSLQELDAINADRRAQGQPAMGAEEFLTKKRQTSTDLQLYNQYLNELPPDKQPLSMQGFVTQFRGGLAGAQAEARAQVIPAEARTDARNKMVRAHAASRRLNRVSGAVEALADNMILQGGPFQGAAISVTKEGQELDQSVAQLLPEMTALTRVPGVGSQSDLEQRLAGLQLPSSSFHPDVNRRAIEELNLFLKDLEDALGNVAAGQQPGAPSAAPEAKRVRVDAQGNVIAP